MKKSVSNLLCGLCAVALVGGVGVGLYYGNSSVRGWFDGVGGSSASSAGSSASSASVGNVAAVQIKLLTTGTDADGNETRTFSYSITPSNATDKSITTSLAWTDSTVTDAISSYYSVAVDSSAMTITVTMKQRAGYQATLKVSSAVNSSLSSSVTVDCLRHLRTVEKGSFSPFRGIDLAMSLDDTENAWTKYTMETGIPAFQTYASGHAIYAITSGITCTLDDVYSKVPQATVTFSNPVLQASGLWYCADYSDGTLDDMATLATGPISASAFDFSSELSGTITHVGAVSAINSRITALDNNSREYLGTKVVSSTTITSQYVCLYSLWNVDVSYGTDLFTRSVSMGLRVPFSEISFNVPVSGVSTSDTGIEF